MFEPLSEMRGGTKRRAGGAVVSMLVHAMVVAGAVQATERVVKGGSMTRTDTLAFVLAKPSHTASEVIEEIPLPGVPEPVSMDALPEIPTVGIPSIDLGTKVFDAARVVGQQAQTGVTGIASEARPASSVAAAFASSEVDDPAVAVSQPLPRYPAELEHAGVHGFVELEYVIDETGHVERESVRVVLASHAGFVEAARASILAGVYRPARYRGSVVRQLVSQKVVFGGE